ncbi:hypothetical protein LCGC14_1312220 [marine sediment metagenome]|uniref:Uncharacterized protein n=1 Tax=marine sediment metagenome TaxID=412755 RepID=A0A0F9N2X2_9ZZZZ
MDKLSEEVKEKDEKRKIRVISEIDDLIGIQGQAYMKGQLKETLTYAEQIINLATPENLQSFIREQEELIVRVKGIQKQREEKAKIKLKLEQEKLKREKLAKFKVELSELENSFNIAFKTEDFLRAAEFLDQSKKILSEIEDNQITKKWEELVKKNSDAQARKELVKSANELIAESSDLLAKFEFADLKLRLTYLIQQAKDKGITDYLKRLKELQSEVLIAEKEFIKTQVKVEDLVKKTRILQDNKKYEEAISNCENLLKFAESIDLRSIIEEFSNILLQLRKDLDFKNLTESIEKLNNVGLELVKKGEILGSLDKFKLIREALENYIN